jgi:hypothetical protein
MSSEIAEGESKDGQHRLLWLMLLISIICVLVGVAAGFNIRQPSLVSEPVKEARAAAEELEKAAVEAQRDPRDISDQLASLETKARAVPTRHGRESLLSNINAVDRKLDEQSDRLESALWSTQMAARRVRDQLDKQLRVSNDPVVTGYDQLKRFLKWLGPLVALSILVLVFLIAFPGTRRWLSRAQSVSVGGVAINVHDPAAVREGVRERFQEVDAAISAAYLEKLNSADVEDLFARFKGEIDKQIEKSFAVDLKAVPHRGTLWVPGFTGSELVQAARYYGTIPDSRPVIGRRFSVRYGIIGRAFRLRATQYNWDVSNEANALIRHWGLTRGEARKQGSQHNSLLAFVIENHEPDSDPLAVIYLEAAGTNRFMPGKQIPELKSRVNGDPNGRWTADKLAHDMIWQPLLDSKAADPLIGALMNLRRAFNWDLKIISADGR